MKKVTDLPDIWKEYLKENSSMAKLALYVKINIIRGPWDFNEGESLSHRFPSQKNKQNKTSPPPAKQHSYYSSRQKLLSKVKGKNTIFNTNLYFTTNNVIMGN